MAKKRNDNTIIVEYQQSQNSAEHYNNMGWTLVSVLLGFSITSLYIYFNSQEWFLKYLALMGGIFSVLYFGILIEKADKIKNINYKICKDIEKDENFRYRPHNQTKNIPKVGTYFIRIAEIMLLLTYLGLTFIEIFIGKSILQVASLFILFFFVLASYVFLIYIFHKFNK